MTWNMARILKKIGNRDKKHCLTWNMAEILKNVKEEKCTLQDLKYGKKTENHGKRDTHTVGSKIWREILKNQKNQKCTWNMARNMEYGMKTEERGK